MRMAAELKKLLVANRSEIAIRCFRAGTELGLRTVAVYSHEDRFSSHRFKADEAYAIGPAQGGEPVRAYLDIDQIIRVAKRCGADAIHPGYGFLSENVLLAKACEAEGLHFVGPTAAQLEMFGDKTAAKRLAESVSVATVPGMGEALGEDDDVEAFGARVGYPLIVKASFGGGGRGIRVVLGPEELSDKVAEAKREASAAFGRADIFLERYIPNAKHIEVQLLGDAHGNLVHLWERDCSVQRRHQKVVEIAPSPSLAEDVRQRICEAAVLVGRAVQYRAAGTVEFLVDVDSGAFYFIEVNPRIQVEHTVTEMVTGIDVVRCQILLAAGHALHESPVNVPRQEAIETRGFALQCRVTTEDPENRFIPDYGRITTYRYPGGFAVRLDGGNAFAGAVITPYFDSLLVKLTTWGTSLDEAVRRAERSLREFRIRGVKTNISFVLNLIRDPTFLSGNATTRFLDETPALFEIAPPRDRATKLLRYLGDVIVNGRPDVKLDAPVRTLVTPSVPVVSSVAAVVPPEAGTRQRLQELGPVRFAEWVRAEQRLLITDTTFRDAHQSLLATRVRTYDLLAIAETVAHSVPGLFSLEMWGGATFDTSMRFLQEDPWDRLIALRQRIPNVLFQMLLRGSNAVGYTSYPDNVVRAFIQRSAANGIDVFRIFDSLNSTENMQVGMEAVRTDTNAVCEAAICYTGDILDPTRTKYSLDYYVRLAKELVRMGTHILAIKDMAGLCRPHAAYALVKALRDEVGVPIHFHTHDMSGISGGSVLRAVDAGADIADAAIASMSGMTSQPCLDSIVAALRNTDRDTGLDPGSLEAMSRYWGAVRDLYYPFEEGLRAPGADVYQHEMPGGQYTNLRRQAKGLGLDERWDEVCQAYAEANRLCGDIVKVTPSSKVVGDLAMFMVTNGLTAKDILETDTTLNFPRSVVEMMQGMLGQPDGGWPKPFQEIVLRSARVEPIVGRPGAALPPADLDGAALALRERIGREPRDEDVLSYLLYPSVFLDYAEHRREYGDTAVVPTRNFFYGLRPGDEIKVEIEPGKTLIVRYLATGDLRADGSRTVFFELNGQPREVTVTDRGAGVIVDRRPKAEPDNAGHVAAPMPGKVSALAVLKGQSVSAGQHLFSLEAMKMETAVSSPLDGTVADVLITLGDAVDAGDLLMVLE
jgi:pyruvate carboxylase